MPAFSEGQHTQHGVVARAGEGDQAILDAHHGSAPGQLTEELLALLWRRLGVWVRPSGTGPGVRVAVTVLDDGGEPGEPVQRLDDTWLTGTGCRYAAQVSVNGSLTLQVGHRVHQGPHDEPLETVRGHGVGGPVWWQPRDHELVNA